MNLHSSLKGLGRAFFFRQRKLGYGGVAALAVLSILCSRVAYALDVQTGDDGFNITFIGVNQQPPDVDINVSPQLSASPTGSQAVILDLGENATGFTATFGGFVETDDGGNLNCTEVGAWSVWDDAGNLVDWASFNAQDIPPGGISEAPGTFRYIAFSGLPFADTTGPDGGPCQLDQTIGAGSWEDTSDYTITSFEFTPESGQGLINLFQPFRTGGEVPGPPLYENLAFDPLEEVIIDDLTLESPAFGPEGEFVVEPDKCEGGTGSGSGTSCKLDLDTDFSTSFQDADDVSGTLEVVSAVTIEDQRVACGGNGTAAAGTRFDGGALVLENYPTPEGGELTIPAHLCGIPNPDTDIPEFVVIDVDSDLTISNSVIFHEANDPLNSAFVCKPPAQVTTDADRSTQPVLGWLPRDGEIPVRARNGAAVAVLEDLTTGCGSYRGRTGRMSYLSYNLRHVPNADYDAIIADDIQQLIATVEQWQPCVSNNTFRYYRFVLSRAAALFQRGRYDRVRYTMERFRAGLFGDRWLEGVLLQCYYNGSASPEIQFSNTGGQGLEPRNFRGDLLAQTDHILYMLETMLGVD